MRNMILISVLLAAVSTMALPAAARGHGEPCPLPDDPAVLLDLIWPLVDANGDGGISYSEILALYPLEWEYFNLVDANGDGLITRNEIITILPLLAMLAPGGLLVMVDTNGDGLIQYSEVSDFATREQFDLLDRNGNGVIDCADIGDVPPPGEGEGEGEDEGECEGEDEGECEGEHEGEGEGEDEGEPPVSECPVPGDPVVLLRFIWPVIDLNSDGGISLDELAAVVPDYLVSEYDLARYFSLLDTNRDGKITITEVQPFLPLLADLLGGDLPDYVDLNGDGVITYGEISEYVTPEQFAQLDRNGDGVIDCLDFELPPAPCPLPDDIGVLLAIAWPHLDADGNGMLSFEEVSCFIDDAYLLPYLESIFLSMDANGDGLLCYEEMLPVLPDILVGLGMYPLLAALDWNLNGVLDYDEVSDILTPEQFALADLNGNGVIDCNDIIPPPDACDPLPGEGEGEGEWEPPLVCPVPRDLELWVYFVWPVIDLDGDGLICWTELRAVLPAWLVYSEDIDMVFALVDANRDGLLSVAEVLPSLPMLTSLIGEDPLNYIDANRDGIITYNEVAMYIPPEQFAMLDVNGDGVIDCHDFGIYPPGEGEGEGEEDGEEEYCPLPNDWEILLRHVWPVVDLDGDGQLSLAEVQAVLPVSAADFAVIDTNGDGLLSHAEVLNYVNGLIWIMIYPGPPLSLVDLNGNGVIEYEEVAGVLAQDQFNQLDRNGNGVIDCYDLDDITPPPPPPRPNPFLRMLQELFPLIDANYDGALSYEEVLAFYPVPPELFAAVDLNGDGLLTMDEILAAFLDEEPGFGHDSLLRITRRAGNGYYRPGEPLTVVVTIHKVRDGYLSALGLWEELPEGWTLAEVVDSAGAEAAPEPGDSGRIEFVWLNMPVFPARIVYRVNVPEDADGVHAILGAAVYRGADSGELSTEIIPTPLAPDPGEDMRHSADTDGDWSISLSEMLRVIQIYNVGGYQCGEDTEDGYALFAGAVGCAPHRSDYNPQDWRIDLSELLRTIQLFNSPGQYYYVQEGSEDGFAPGIFVLN